MNLEHPPREEKTPSGERPHSEPNVFDAAQEAEAIKWDAGRKGHVAYWIQILAERPPIDLPRDIQAIVRTANKNLQSVKKTKIAPAQNSIMTKYISEHVKELIAQRKAAPKPTDALGTSVVEMSETVGDIQDDEMSSVGHGLIPERPELEAQDFKNSTQKAGWTDYWLPRLREESDSLTDEIASIVGSEDARLSPEEVSTLKLYVDARLRALTFKLAKSKMMGTLREELRSIDERDEMEPLEIISRRTVSYDESRDEMYVEEHGKRRPVTEDDIVADLMWGVKYRPDDSVPPAAWRRLRKLSAIKEAHANIEHLWNRELAEREGVSLPTTSYTPEFLEENPQAGVVAERMLQSLLTRIQDKTGLRVESSNAIEDHQLKYDFKIVYLERVRGVALTEKGGTREAYVTEKKRIGIQFTINMSAHDHKTKQILKAKQQLGDERYKSSVSKPVDDIVLVSVEMKDVGAAFRKWLADGKPTGGPESYLSKQQKRELLESVLQNVPGFDLSLLEEAL